MASQVDIANLTLTLLGQESISSISEDRKAARLISTNFDIIRDEELSKRWWRFAVKRTEMASLVAAPTGNDFSIQYQLPNDFLSIIRLGDSYQGYDASDYRTGPTNEYSIEGDKLLTNYGSPLLIVYSAKITDTSVWHPCFNSALAARMAYMLCEDITGSSTRQEFCTYHYKQALSTAMLSNAMLNGPQYRADNSWMLARLG